MATMRDIRRRIRSTAKTQQITKAMNMVSAAKLRKVQERVVASRPYSQKLREVLVSLVAMTRSEADHPLLKQRPENRSAFVVVTGDNGLCGGYNSNVIKLAEDAVRNAVSPENVLLTVGRKGRDYFRRRGYNILREYLDLGDNPSFPQAKALAGELVELFTSNTVDHIYLVFNRFYSAVRQEPEIVPLLPITGKLEGNGESDGGKPMPGFIFEPEPQELFGFLLPRYVDMTVYQMLMEAKTSEQAARMTAMEAATSAADDMINDLTISLNKARQAAITRELADITGTARAFD